MIVVSITSSKWLSFKFPLVEMLFYRVRCARLYSPVSVFGERERMSLETSLNMLLSTGMMCIVSLSSIYLVGGDDSDGELEKIN